MSVSSNLALAVFGLCTFLSACAQQANRQMPLGAESAPVSPANQGCGDLSNDLYVVLRSTDPASAARSTGVIYDHGSVEAEIVLIKTPGKPEQRARDARFVLQYHVVIHASSYGAMEARVPLETLCDLSKDQEVIHVERPGPLVP